MKIYDCTTFYSEKMMLDLRFNILNENVYKFIVIESSFSHSGKKKNLILILMITLNLKIKLFI